MIEIDPRHPIPPSPSDLLLHSWGYDLVQEYRDVIARLPRVNEPILELATGTGRMCAVLALHFPRIITGDITLTDLPRVRQRVPSPFIERISFVQLTMEALPVPSESIRTLVCMNTLHETADPERCLAEMIRVVHPDGFFVVGDFNDAGFDAMQRLHEQVYHNDHDRGSITLDALYETVGGAFGSVRRIDTPLNRTFIATGKKNIHQK